MSFANIYISAVAILGIGENYKSISLDSKGSNEINCYLGWAKSGLELKNSNIIFIFNGFLNYNDCVDRELTLQITSCVFVIFGLSLSKIINQP